MKTRAVADWVGVSLWSKVFPRHVTDKMPGSDAVRVSATSRVALAAGATEIGGGGGLGRVMLQTGMPARARAIVVRTKRRRGEPRTERIYWSAFTMVVTFVRTIPS